MEVKKVYGAMSKAVAKLSEMEIKKSGFNKHMGDGVAYMELSDFLPKINKVCGEFNLCHVFNFESDGKKTSLTVFSAEDGSSINFRIPVRSAVNDGDQKPKMQIQVMGAQTTYLRRYLYMNAFGIVENDQIDNQEPPKQDNTKTPPQGKTEPKRTPPKQAPVSEEVSPRKQLTQLCKELNLTAKDVAEKMNLTKESTDEEVMNAVKIIKAKGGL